MKGWVGSREARQRDKSEHLPSYSRKEQQNAKVKFPPRNSSNLTFACLVGGHTVPFYQWERGLTLLQTEFSSTINTQFGIHLSTKLRDGMRQIPTKTNTETHNRSCPLKRGQRFFPKVPGMKRLDCKTFKTPAYPRPSVYW